MLFVVTCSYGDHAIADRDRLRGSHVEFLRNRVATGDVVACGRVDEDGESVGSVLIVSAPSAEAAGATLDDDPFATEGIFATRSVRAWSLAFGAERFER